MTTSERCVPPPPARGWTEPSHFPRPFPPARQIAGRCSGETPHTQRSFRCPKSGESVTTFRHGARSRAACGANSLCSRRQRAAPSPPGSSWGEGQLPLSASLPPPRETDSRALAGPPRPPRLPPRASRAEGCPTPREEGHFFHIKFFPHSTAAVGAACPGRRRPRRGPRQREAPVRPEAPGPEVQGSGGGWPGVRDVGRCHRLSF